MENLSYQQQLAILKGSVALNNWYNFQRPKVVALVSWFAGFPETCNWVLLEYEIRDWPLVWSRGLGGTIAMLRADSGCHQKMVCARVAIHKIIFTGAKPITNH